MGYLEFVKIAQTISTVQAVRDSPTVIETSGIRFERFERLEHFERI